MKRTFVLAALGVALLSLSAPFSTGPAFGQRGGRGGGGGGGRGFAGGGGGGRPAASAPQRSPATPSFNRPAPSVGNQGGGLGNSRPGFAGGGLGNTNRPSTLPAGGNRPSGGANLGGGQRPQAPNTGAIGGGNRPNIGSGTRPGGQGPGTGVDRPGVRPVDPGFSRPAIGNRPNIDNRPGIGNRPDRPIVDNRPDGNRPNMSIGNRQVNANVNNVNVNRWNQYNQQVNANRHWSYRPTNWNRPWYGNRPAWYWSRPWYNYHWRWHYGYWNYWRTPPALWFGAGAIAGFLASPGDTYVYNNPYYVEPPTTVVVQPALDYASPIPAPPPDQTLAAYPPDPAVADDGSVEDLSTTAPPAPSTEDSTVNDANTQFDAAREAFKMGNYAKAQNLAEKALALLPSDATLHEFRALTLFAQKKYKEAAAGLYAVLAAGPGWDWQTMSALYANVDAYTRQLRALEAFSGDHPDDGDAHFLLAYQYLVLGSKDAAVRQLKEVVRLVPQDKLSAALLKALTSPEEPTVPAPKEGR